MDKQTREDLKRFTAPVGTALDRFIAQKQGQFPYATGELSQLLRDIALAGKIINREINRAGLTAIEASVGIENVQGERQLMLDVVADTRFHRALNRGGQTCALISEEREGITHMDNLDAKYVVAMDPLDGSSNVDVNVSVGTIFSIYRRISPEGIHANEDDMLQRGCDQVAAGYILYGSSTMLVYSTGVGVFGFTYEPSLGEYFLSHPNIQIPESGKILSINMGANKGFSKGLKNYLSHAADRGFNTRYIGSLVADFHRNMLKGGIYIYPSSAKYPKGKLRLMHECNALAFICEGAGGIATDGKRRILELEPSELHERVPLYMGSRKMVEQAMDFLAQEEAEPETTDERLLSP